MTTKLKEICLVQNNTTPTSIHMLHTYMHLNTYTHTYIESQTWKNDET